MIRAVALAVALGVAAPAFADIPPEKVAASQAAEAAAAPTDAPSTTFRAADPSQFKEDLSGIPFLVSAYAAIWAVLFGYVVLLVRRTRRLEGEVAALRADIAKAERAP